MNVLQDVEQMPPYYREVYYQVCDSSGTEMYQVVSEIVNRLEKRKRKSKEQKMELELFKALLPYKYNEEDIHPQYRKFKEFFWKTKRSTDVATRKKFNLFATEPFGYAFTAEYVAEMKETISTLGKEVMEEVIELALKEEERIRAYQEAAPKRTVIGNQINRALAEIAPHIINEAKNKHNFFTKLGFRKNKIGFFITSGKGKEYDILTESLKNAEKSTELDLQGLNDEANNYFITFTASGDQAFMRTLLKNRLMKEVMEGIKLMGIPIQILILKCRYKGMKIDEIEWHELEFNSYFEAIENSIFAFNNRMNITSYSDDSIRYVISQLMELTKSESELHLACHLYYNFLQPVQTYVNKREAYFKEQAIELSYEEYEARRTAIYQELIADGKANIKWKSEVDLYKMVKKIFPDALYQYRAPWLDQQSLDIFIPSLSIGIEYHGLQHYEPVEFFGGEKAFLYRQQLDALKKEKCQENNIQLIEWSYQDVISATNFKRKLKEMKFPS